MLGVKYKLKSYFSQIKEKQEREKLTQIGKVWSVLFKLRKIG